jgi:hypothetical protein
MEQSTTVEDFITALKSEGKVCPQPEKWNQLYKMLPNRRQVGASWEPSPPLILAAWHHTSDFEKRGRLALHLRWAEQHQCLLQIVDFLNTLESQEWHTETHKDS